MHGVCGIGYWANSDASDEVATVTSHMDVKDEIRLGVAHEIGMNVSVRDG